MQRTISELTSLSGDELSTLIDRLGEPLLVTQDGEPQFVAQSLTAFESMVRRLRLLEAERRDRAESKLKAFSTDRLARRGQVIPIRP